MDNDENKVKSQEKTVHPKSSDKKSNINPRTLPTVSKTNLPTHKGDDVISLKGAQVNNSNLEYEMLNKFDICKAKSK